MNNSGENREILEYQDSLYPPITIIFFLGLAVALSAMIGSLINYVLAESSGFDLVSWLSGDGSAVMSFTDRQWLRLSMGISHLFSFIVPSILLALFFKKVGQVNMLDFSPTPSWSLTGLGILFLYASMPVAQALYWLNKQLPLPDWATQLEDSSAHMIQYLLTMESPLEIFLALLVVAVLPAIGEELVFRGFLQKQLYKILPSPHLSIIIAALLFSLMHFQFEGFLARAFLGGCLGYLYYWSGSLWLPIIAHFFHNAIQVVAFLYLEDPTQQLESITNVEAPNGYLVLGASLAMIGLVWMLDKQKVPFQTKS